MIFWDKYLEWCYYIRWYTERANTIKVCDEYFGSSMRPKNQNKKDEKYLTLMSVNDLWGREMLINAFQSRIFPANSGACLVLAMIILIEP